MLCKQSYTMVLFPCQYIQCYYPQLLVGFRYSSDLMLCEGKKGVTLFWSNGSGVALVP